MTAASRSFITDRKVFVPAGRAEKQYQRVYDTQMDLLDNMKKLMRKCDAYGLSRDKHFVDLVLKMLEPDPLRRISPMDVLSHPFVV